MRSISRCFNSQLADICQRSIQLEELSNKVMQLLPANFVPHCKVGSYNKGCLILTTTDAGWASQLRYVIPELRDKLRKEKGMYQLSSIKINVVSEELSPVVSERFAGHKLSEEAKATIIKESQSCTYQPLKDALISLADGS